MFPQQRKKTEKQYENQENIGKIEKRKVSLLVLALLCRDLTYFTKAKNTSNACSKVLVIPGPCTVITEYGKYANATIVLDWFD